MSLPMSRRALVVAAVEQLAQRLGHPVRPDRPVRPADSDFGSRGGSEPEFAAARAWHGSVTPFTREAHLAMFEQHGLKRTDEYYWLRDDKRENPEMLAYVTAENAYADAMLAHIKPLETKVYNEIVGRLQQDDSTVPYLMNGYWYFRRYETGKEYPIFARRAGTLNAAEEILLDVNAMAKGHGFFDVGGQVPDNGLEGPDDEG